MTNLLRTEFQWYAVFCHPQKEGLAASALRNYFGLSVYLPLVARRFRSSVQQVPLFPRYLFVRANLELVPPSKLNTVPGILRMVTLGGLPQAVPLSIIKELRQWVARIDADGGLADHDFQPGDKVRLTAGPLYGLEAIFVGPTEPSQRVQILIEFLGRLSEIEVQVDQVERVQSTDLEVRVDQVAHNQSVPLLKQTRRTRGRGRVIKRQ